jgi:methionine-rich copper-binding protein CopC
MFLAIPFLEEINMKPLALFAGMLLLAFPTFAMGHAFVDHALPRVGSTVQTPPDSVKIWFTEEIEPAFSSMEVLSSDGKQVDKQDCRVDDKDKTLLIVSLPQLGAGTYKVHWHVVAPDTHHTEGDFTFTVKPKDSP